MASSKEYIFDSIKKDFIIITNAFSLKNYTLGKMSFDKYYRIFVYMRPYFIFAYVFIILLLWP